jgi:hypothetical protein
MEDSAERYPVLPSSCSPAVAISTPLAPLGMSDLDGYSVEEDQSIVRVATTANLPDGRRVRVSLGTPVADSPQPTDALHRSRLM